MNIGRFIMGMEPAIIKDVLFKILPNLIQKSKDFPTPPKEIKEAVIMQSE
ncbi:MAG: hypothetical protein NC489_32295 [Ruminococcus flavefaciens]|nr:hypothetical protein [Ruminococcus flavefaciens]